MIRSSLRLCGSCKDAERPGFQWLLQVYVVDSPFTCLDTLDHLSKIRILYLQRITDQRSGFSWYRTVGYE